MAVLYGDTPLTGDNKDPAVSQTLCLVKVSSLYSCRGEQFLGFTWLMICMTNLDLQGDSYCFTSFFRFGNLGGQKMEIGSQSPCVRDPDG